MVFSLLVAFVITPWAALRLMKRAGHGGAARQGEDLFTRLYRRFMSGAMFFGHWPEQAGIVVRNSIILVDFIELRLRMGEPLERAVVDAGAIRFRPMMLTAAAVVVGSAVILFDPIFQGLAISLMAGEVASLFLSRMTVPVLFFMMNKRRIS
jgi:multidrug efflux pump subunit AcrB